MKINVDLNIIDSMSRNVRFAELNWGEPLPLSIPVTDASLILEADCVYFEVGNSLPPSPSSARVKLQSASIPTSREDSLRPLSSRQRRRDPFLLEEETKGVFTMFGWSHSSRKADKRFFVMLRKHFDSETVMDDKAEEMELYRRDAVSLVRLKRRK